jgi:hypothetical protein
MEERRPKFHAEQGPFWSPFSDLMGDVLAAELVFSNFVAVRRIVICMLLLLCKCDLPDAERVIEMKTMIMKVVDRPSSLVQGRTMSCLEGKTRAPPACDTACSCLDVSVNQFPGN